ncbi:MAG TPA: Ku protein [Mycobacteriales bacterium]|nr:Ku protein [Mycobacteriales bacterium]
MRSIWKGSISFGLVTIPVKLYSATEEKDISFRQVHRADGGRIRYKRECTIDGEEIPYSDIAKGYEMPDGSMVVLTDDDLASVPLTTSRAIDVVQFVPLEQLDPIYFNRSYYLEPDKAGVKPYVLLARALEKSGQVAVVKVALRQRESLAALRVRDGVFVLETMLWPDEVREPEFGFLDEDVDVRPQELAMAGTLIESLSGDFEPTEHTDAYREALEELIEAKVAGQEVVQPVSAAPTAGAVVDLMAALRASVDAAKSRTAEPRLPRAESRPAAKKPAAKRSGSAKAAKPARKATATKAAKPAAKAAAKPRAAARKSA